MSPRYCAESEHVRRFWQRQRACLLVGLSAAGGQFLPVISELQGDAEVVSAEHPDDVLQLVLGRRRDT